MTARSAPDTARQIREVAPTGERSPLVPGPRQPLEGGSFTVPLRTVGRNTSRPYGQSTRTVAAGDRATAPAHEQPALDTRCERASAGRQATDRPTDRPPMLALPQRGGPVRSLAHSLTPTDGAARMIRCHAQRRNGTACTLPAQPGAVWCHVHNPAGKYRQQHPGARPPRLYLFLVSLLGVRDWQLG